MGSAYPVPGRFSPHRPWLTARRTSRYTPARPGPNRSHTAASIQRARPGKAAQHGSRVLLARAPLLDPRPVHPRGIGYDLRGRTGTR